MNNQCNKRWEYSLWAIIVVICCSIPWLVRQVYAGGRYCDGIGIISFPMLIFMQWGAIIIFAISAFAFAVRRSIKNKKLYAYIVLAIALAFTVSFYAYRVGEDVWKKELGANEKVAQAIVAILEAYKTEYGAYPDSLDQIGKGGIVMQRGRFKEELQYEKSNGHFSLSIYYGWYHRVYESQTDQWGWHDD